MSRIGKKSLSIPAGVEVTLSASDVTIKGPKGHLSQQLHDKIEINIEGDTLTVNRKDETQLARSVHGLYRTLVSNMIEGVTKGYEKKLEIVGVGYRVAMKGKDLDLSLGFSHPVLLTPAEGIEYAVEGQQKIVVKGIDKQKVGQIAADIRKIRKPEPYKGKGIRYEGERIVRKAGKTGKK